MRIFGYLSEISLICSNNIRSIKSICSRVLLPSSLFLFNSNLELANQIVANLLGCRTNKNICYSYNRKSHSWNIHIFFSIIYTKLSLVQYKSHSVSILIWPLLIGSMKIVILISYGICFLKSFWYWLTFISLFWFTSQLNMEIKIISIAILKMTLIFSCHFKTL